MAGLLILPSTVIGAAGTTTYTILPNEHIERWHAAMFMLETTAAAAAATDTLDVYLQSACDGGTVYDDFVHFTQLLGNGGASQKRLASWIAGYNPTTAERAQRDGTIAAGVQQGPVGDIQRVKVAVVGGTAAFTLKVWAAPIRR